MGLFHKSKKDQRIAELEFKNDCLSKEIERLCETLKKVELDATSAHLEGEIESEYINKNIEIVQQGLKMFREKEVQLSAIFDKFQTLFNFYLETRNKMEEMTTLMALVQQNKKGKIIKMPSKLLKKKKR